jgi:hypothetical protein
MNRDRILTMRLLVIVLAATGCAAARPPVAAASLAKPVTARELAKRFAREFCVPGVDRLQKIRAWNLPGWQAGPSQERLGVTYNVDAPTPEHDRHDLSYTGPVKGGKARISSITHNYKDAGRVDFSFAALWIEPETLIDQAAIEKALGVRLIPNGKLTEWPGAIRITSPGKEPVMTKGPSRWAQHYNASSSFGESVSIEGYRAWGEGAKEQVWRLSCSNYRAPTWLSD